MVYIKEVLSDLRGVKAEIDLVILLGVNRYFLIEHLRRDSANRIQ